MSKTYSGLKVAVGGLLGGGTDLDGDSAFLISPYGIVGYPSTISKDVSAGPYVAGRVSLIHRLDPSANGVETTAPMGISVEPHINVGSPGSKASQSSSYSSLAIQPSMIAGFEVALNTRRLHQIKARFGAGAAFDGANFNLVAEIPMIAFRASQSIEIGAGLTYIDLPTMKMEDTFCGEFGVGYSF